MDSESLKPDPRTDSAFQVNPDSDPIRIQGFNNQKLKEKNAGEIFLDLFDQKLQFTYTYASIKDVQATGEAFSSQKKTSSTSKNEIY